MDRSSSRDMMIHGLDFTSRLPRNDGNDFFAVTVHDLWPDRPIYIGAKRLWSAATCRRFELKGGIGFSNASAGFSRCPRHESGDVSPHSKAASPHLVNGYRKCLYGMQAKTMRPGFLPLFLRPTARRVR